MISGTNQPKTIVSPLNTVKTRNTQAIYGMGIYGLVVYGVGAPSGVPTNQTKSTTGQTTITAGTPMGLLLSITYPTTFVIGSGFINQSKS